VDDAKVESLTYLVQHLVNKKGKLSLGFYVTLSENLISAKLEQLEEVMPMIRGLQDELTRDNPDHFCTSRVLVLHATAAALLEKARKDRSDQLEALVKTVAQGMKRNELRVLDSLSRHGNMLLADLIRSTDLPNTITEAIVSESQAEGHISLSTDGYYKITNTGRKRRTELKKQFPSLDWNSSEAKTLMAVLKIFGRTGNIPKTSDLTGALGMSKWEVNQGGYWLNLRGMVVTTIINPEHQEHSFEPTQMGLTCAHIL
jgi:hypothetical protein